jgi:hypothetical protein
VFNLVAECVFVGVYVGQFMTSKNNIDTFKNQKFTFDIANKRNNLSQNDMTQNRKYNLKLYKNVQNLYRYFRVLKVKGQEPNI